MEINYSIIPNVLNGSCDLLSAEAGGIHPLLSAVTQGLAPFKLSRGAPAKSTLGGIAFEVVCKMVADERGTGRTLTDIF